MMQSSSATSLFSNYASLTGSIMLIRTMVDQLIPRPLRAYIVSTITYLFRHILPIKNKKLTLVIEPERETNEMYKAVELYLPTILGPNIEKLKVGKYRKQNNFSLTVVKNQQVYDRFNNVHLTWEVVSESKDSKNDSNQKETTFFELTFDKKFKDVVMNEYLPHLLSEAKRKTENNKEVKLYTKRYKCIMWDTMILDHPATFDTIAISSDLKNSIIQDLDKFVRRKEFYRRVGKPWKRGYMLYGPPGTGKSSLIAAIANYLKFDIYDIQLTSMSSDFEFSRMLLTTSNRSLIVIEDVDCSSTFQNREDPSDDDKSNSTSLSLSGLLNFADGLWSSCGEERIIIFTTNYKDKLDPALLRPGRMDMHIHMSYCTYESFRILASRYLGDEFDSELLEEIESLIGDVEVTPAEVAEELLRSEDPDLALQGVVDRLKLKKVEGEAKKSNENYSASPLISLDKIDNGGWFDT